MSHSKVYRPLDPITEGCATLPLLVPGEFYSLASQVLGSHTYTLYFQARTTAVPFSDVQVIFSGGGRAWGKYNWSACQLDYLKDDKNNEVHGAPNVTAFPWENALVTGNLVGPGSTLTITATVPITDLSDNSFINGAIVTVDGTGALTMRQNLVTGAGAIVVDITNTAIISFVGNVWNAGNTHINSTAGSAGHQISTNFFSAATFNLLGSRRYNIQNNSIVGSTLDIGITTSVAAATLTTITNNGLVGLSNMTLAAGLFNAALTIQGNQLSNAGTMTITGGMNNSASVTISFNLLSNATMTVSSYGNVSGGTLNNNDQRSNGNVVITTTATPVTFTNNIVVKGTFTNAGFNSTNGQLLNASTTLIANVTDATKTNYPNSLP